MYLFYWYITLYSLFLVIGYFNPPPLFSYNVNNSARNMLIHLALIISIGQISNSRFASLKNKGIFKGSGSLVQIGLQKCSAGFYSY